MFIRIIDNSGNVSFVSNNEYTDGYLPFECVEEAKGYIRCLIAYRPMLNGLFWNDEVRVRELSKKKFHFEVIDYKDEYEYNVLWESEDFFFETEGEYHHRLYVEEMSDIITKNENNENEDFSNI